MERDGGRRSGTERDGARWRENDYVPTLGSWI